jgi:hypothetical protein
MIWFCGWGMLERKSEVECGSMAGVAKDVEGQGYIKWQWFISWRFDRILSFATMILSRFPRNCCAYTFAHHLLLGDNDLIYQVRLGFRGRDVLLWPGHAPKEEGSGCGEWWELPKMWKAKHYGTNKLAQRAFWIFRGRHQRLLSVPCHGKSRRHHSGRPQQAT